jgi:hypothetical protein
MKHSNRTEQYITDSPFSTTPIKGGDIKSCVFLSDGPTVRMDDATPPFIGMNDRLWDGNGNEIICDGE